MARAQPAAPTLRAVTQLRPVPEPPGGLVPFRQGRLWGYADTTGVVAITPIFQTDYEPLPFFQRGFVFLPPTALPDAWQPPVATLSGAFMNGRGEVLSVRWEEVAVLRPDGSLQATPRPQAVGERVLLPQHDATHPLLRDFVEFTVRQFGRGDDTTIVFPDEQPRYHNTYDEHYLGEDRATQAISSPGGRYYQRGMQRPRHYALTTTQGQLLTSYKFNHIRHFWDGLAATSVRHDTYWQKIGRQQGWYSGRPPARWGYLDRAGHWRMRPAYDGVSDFRRGVAVVRQGLRYGIINTKGKFQFPLQANWLSAPDEAGLVRTETLTYESFTASPDSVQQQRERYRRLGLRWQPPTPEPIAAQFQYLTTTGQPAFAGTGFDDAGPFVQRRAWVRQGERAGLINPAGAWITPEAYYSLTAAPRFGNGDPETTGSGEFTDDDLQKMSAEPDLASHKIYGVPPGLWPRRLLPDTAYLVGWRDGYYGLVARASGRETTPCRYDAVLLRPFRGLACLQRADTTYLVDAASGHELLAGDYRGIDLQTPRGRRLYLTRTEPAAWALADSTGRLCTPWVPGRGFPTPEGWLLSQDSNGWTLCDSAGAVGYELPYPIRHPRWSSLWEAITATDRLGYDILLHWQLPFSYRSSPPGAAYLIQAPDTWHYLDAQLCEIGRSPASRHTQLRPNGWSFGIDSQKRWSILVSDTGQLINMLSPDNPAASSDNEWLQLDTFDYSRAWHRHGVLPTTKGLLTRGRRPLWID